MISINDKTLCCGCNACGDICAHNAISFQTDNEGFWYPDVDASKCVDCGLCEKVCPVANINDLKKNDLPESICYAAEHKNLEIVFDSTSGGLFSALAEAVYREKGYVGGAVFGEDLKSVHHFISNDRKDIEALRSSKYLQSNAEGFYSEVKSLLNAGEKVLVCGTPCQMAALRAYLRKDYDNLIIVDFVCRGINSPKVWGKYIDSFEERYGSKVVYAKAKSKEYGWRKLTQKVILQDGRSIYETKDQSMFTQGYLQTNAYCRPSCYECKFKGFPRISDITLADFWGVETLANTMDKDLGTSLVMINSEKGKTFFERIKPRISFINVENETAIKGNPALLRPLAPPYVDRDAFFNDLNAMSFTELAEKYIKRKEKKTLRSSLKKEYNRLLLFKHMLNRSPKALCQTINVNGFRNMARKCCLAFEGVCTVNIAKGASVISNGLSHFGTNRIKGSKLESRLLLEDGAKLEFQGSTNIYYGADIELFKNSKVVFKGGTGANINLTIVCGEYIEIGKDVQIGRNVTIRDNNGGHYINRPGYKDKRPVIIGDKVWLCEGCTIMPGVKIGDGAIVGAGAFVTTNVPAHSMVAGNPAVVVDENVLWKY